MMHSFRNVTKRVVVRNARFSAVATHTHGTIMTAAGPLDTTNQLHIINTAGQAKINVYQILDQSGRVVEGAVEPKLDEATAVKYMEAMIRIHSLDDVMYNAQRQGRISFYMQASGEEAIHIGSASALSPKDMVFAQYREQGVLLWRGFTLQQACDQCFSNESDNGKGRQMPVHYGSRELNYQTISSPLGTQLPQAVGAAYAFKLDRADAIAMCYFGEGAASEGDFHAAMNFSATLEVPIVFFARNNGFAISTPVKDQFRGDGIASRAAGYGMHVIRVDGNDLLAVQAATAAARKLAVEKSCPVLVEAMTYRRGHHSTSDDSTRYRSSTEIQDWQDNNDPIKRFRAYMENKGWWDETKDVELRERERAAVLLALETAENKPKPPLDQLFEDVYESKPHHLVTQEAELLEHIAKYPEHYTTAH